MLQSDLKRTSITAIVDSDDTFYSFTDIYHKVIVYRNLIRVLKLNSDAKTIGIWFKGNFDNVCAFIACLLESVNFTILNSDDELSVTILKIKYANINILFSDIVAEDINVFTVNSEFKIIKQGFRYIVTEELKRNLSTIHNNIDSFNYEAEKLNNSIAIALRKSRHFIGFHSGISDEFKASFFQLDALVLGVNKAKTLPHCDSKKILFLEKFNVIYDVVSGIIAPILMGSTVIFNRDVENGKKHCPSVLYSNSSRLEAILEKVKDSSTTLNNIVLSKLLNVSLIKSFVFKSIYRRYFNGIDLFILTGKLKKKDYGLNGNLVNLYTIAEVASFVSYAFFKKTEKRNPYYVGKVTDNVSVEGFPGEIFVYVEDSCVSYCNYSHIEYSFLSHPFHGKLRVGDAGYIMDDKLFVLGKSKHTFICNNSLIDIEKIREIAESESFIDKAVVYKVDNDLLLLVSISKSHLLKFKSVKDAQSQCNRLKCKINKRIKTQVKAVKILPDIDGFQTIEHRIVLN